MKGRFFFFVESATLTYSGWLLIQRGVEVRNNSISPVNCWWFYQGSLCPSLTFASSFHIINVRESFSLIGLYLLNISTAVKWEGFARLQWFRWQQHNTVAAFELCFTTAVCVPINNYTCTLIQSKRWIVKIKRHVKCFLWCLTAVNLRPFSCLLEITPTLLASHCTQQTRPLACATRLWSVPDEVVCEIRSGWE